ncbi:MULTISPECIES: asparaginase [Streptomyces]|uniref:asparaginase n=2 Tax=Streptomyces TaxID=1883 RepID=A0A1D8G1T0_9ACTN|nr:MULTISPECIES: asparaginase [Streptomyces]AOT59366.1 L-asparaginase [Streptomyces rubrolavendulae]KAF0649589.1 L-asparaginase [Streptomyces fradiae ATCC 10745 = DSM 40063]OSY49183.1 L-asparaginase [Streptomyces fradiae ATCC 10745 = DSM 40063]QEV12637.1 asparaginase [Streptomyces fradiae ATCC 10745 = DSM 40063]UQS32108.1 asparaginase [Streptomyces fradiae]
MGRIVVISTGGTIASRWQGSGFAAEAHGREVMATACVPEGVTVEVVDLFSVNSPRLTTAHQLTLVRTVHEVLADPGVDGVVVTHGTDTLEESAFLVDLHHGDPRPVVFTGAQLPLDAEDGDGPRNLYDALLTADRCRDLGVLIAFDGKVHAARGTVKTHTLDADAFADPSGTRLGTIGFGKVSVPRRPERPAPLPLPDVPAGAPPRVDMVMHHADGDALLLRAAVDAGARGLVLVATGAGNATPEIAAAVAEATARGVLVALTTRVPAGPVAQIYTHGGAVDLVAAGAVPTGTLRAGQARIAVLAALLAAPEPADPAERVRLLRHALGEPVPAPGLAAV